MEDWLRTAFETLMQHIPHNAAWVPYAGTGALALFGLILMFKGARLAPAMAAFACLAIAGTAGSFAAHWLGTPLWPTIIVAGTVGFVVGLALFKIWLALLVGGCFVAASLALYGDKVLSPHLQDYASMGYNADEGVVGVSLAAAQAGVEGRSPWGEVGNLWSHLVATVPSFQTSFWAIVCSTGLAGLVVGLLLPRVSRALCAATAGTACFLIALLTGLKVMWPDALAWLTSLGEWTWTIVALLWGVSLLRNFFDVTRRPRPKPADDAAPAESPVTA